MRKTEIMEYHNDTVQVPTHTFILAIDNRPTEKGLETPQIYSGIDITTCVTVIR